MRKYFTLCVVTGLLTLPFVARAQLNIENPQPFSDQSGVVLVRGTDCQNRATFASIDNGGKLPLINGQARTDVQPDCNGTLNTGWSLLGNIGDLPPGAHTLNIFDGNNALLGSVQFNAVSLGMPFISQPNLFVTMLQDQPETGVAAAVEFSIPDQAFRVNASRSKPGSPPAFDPFAAEFRDKDLELTDQVSGSVTKYKFSQEAQVNSGRALVQELANGTGAAFTNDPEGVLGLADFVSPYNFVLIDTNACIAAFANRDPFNQSQSIGVVVAGARNTAGQCTSFSSVGNKATLKIGVVQ